MVRATTAPTWVRTRPGQEHRVAKQASQQRLLNSLRGGLDDCVKSGLLQGLPNPEIIDDWVVPSHTPLVVQLSAGTGN